MIKRHNKEIRALQARMVDLQRYCSALESHQTNSSSATFNIQNVSEKIKVVVNEQITYYREKNKELEERVDSHIKLNKELKERLESLLKNSNNVNALEYYKQQNDQLQRQNEEYLAKINILTE